MYLFNMYLFVICFFVVYEKLGSKRVKESLWIWVRDGKGRWEERWIGMNILFVVIL